MNSRQSASKPPASPPPRGPSTAAAGDDPNERVVEIPESVSVRALAKTLGKKVLVVLSDLIGLQIFAKGPEAILPFEIAAQVAIKHGFVPKRSSS